ncbi:MAG TPA: beta-galactosidase trimerization domain-containing protein [Chloroflexota bacterium]|nr:beta-galactosidase trimerization domain-containing protein [Chloroflexota bacterium]
MTAAGDSAQRWWRSPFRVVQTNIREPDAAMDVPAIGQDILDTGANAWLLNTAGIVSFYPTALDYQYPTPFLAERASGDLIGDARGWCREHNVRLLSRFDMSKAHPHVYEAHRDWFYVSPQGQPQIYNGLYSTCMNGPYYQEKLFDILAEVTGRYQPDGIFFNAFRIPLADYSRRYWGICQCPNCQRRFAAEFGRDLPGEENPADPAYLDWLRFRDLVSDDLVRRVHDFLREHAPQTAYMRSGRHTDVPTNEVNNAVGRALPLWRYHAGETTRLNRTARPDAPVDILTVYFLDIPYRFAAEQPGLVSLHHAQTLASAGAMHHYVLGTTRQRDRKGVPAVRRLFRYQQEHDDLYRDLRSAAQVLLLRPEHTPAYGGSDADAHYRGAYRALVECHVPFDVLAAGWLTEKAAAGDLARYRAIVLPNAACLDDAQLAALDAYVAAGGGLVATHETAQYDAGGAVRRADGVPTVGLRSLGAASVLTRSTDVRGAYFQVTPEVVAEYGCAFGAPGAADGTELIALDQAYLYVAPRPEASASLALIPPFRFGPPEKCYGETLTEHPGVLWHAFGRGRTAYFPWPVDRLFHDISMPEYRELLRAAVTWVAGGEPAPVVAGEGTPPCVEVTVHDQAASGRRVVHLVNFSGHQDRAFHDPLEIRDLTLRVRAPEGGRVLRARALVAGEPLDVAAADGAPGGWVTLTVPRLGLLEAIALEP